MKLLLYGVSQETVTKEDANKYKLTQKKKKTQMNDCRVIIHMLHKRTKKEEASVKL